MSPTFDPNPLFDLTEPVLINTPPHDDFIERNRFVKRIGELRERFVKDYNRVTEYKDILFGAKTDNYGDVVTKIFSEWDDEDGGPTAPAFIAHAIEHYKLDTDSSIVQCLFASALLAEYPNKLQYHGNIHYRKVIFHTLALTAKNNELNEGKSDMFMNADELAIMLISACIHDLGHVGGDNLSDGVYKPGAMEQLAFDLARPYFERLDLDKGFIGAIETIVFCTDITFNAGENSPCVRMKYIYRYHYLDEKDRDIEMMTLGKLRRYEENPKLSFMAILLHEADIGSSAGLSYEQTIKESINIMEERASKKAGPNSVLAFLKEQLGETMFTDAGKALFGPVMSDVIAKAQEDVARGRKTFYED